MWRLVGDSRSEGHMSLEALTGLAISILLLLYLVYAMLRPEKF
jgi:K+-transporting ATPase KdpF subunit